MLNINYYYNGVYIQIPLAVAEKHHVVFYTFDEDKNIIYFFKKFSSSLHIERIKGPFNFEDEHLNNSFIESCREKHLTYFTEV